MKKILTSLVMIAAVGALVAGATGAFFSDTETSTGNTYTAGTIDISVDGENPWVNSWSNYLDKPCQTNYMNFTIKNEGENPARVWKRLVNVVNGAGEATYPDMQARAAVCSSEPEYVAGGGLFDDAGLPTGQGYVERDNLSAFMIYDMAICRVGDEENAGEVCPMIDDQVGTDGVMHKKPDMSNKNWDILIDEKDQVRVDNVVDTWIKLAEELAVGESLVVSQSYHLMTWDDSGQPMVTNWAQGDTMAFDIELEARQLTAPAPGTTLVNNVVTATAQLVAKNTTSWDPIAEGASAVLTYGVSGETFDYSLVGSGVAAGNYQLVYYPDPWANPKVVTLIGVPFAVDGTGVVNQSGNVELGMDLPTLTDANYPVGAKVWLVPTASLSGNNLSWTNLGQFLFDLSLVNYDDSGIN
jgi:predicted ribosomally synthesized peptide with SipW-like signal peptide